mgnify:CR=1 FL=1
MQQLELKPKVIRVSILRNLAIIKREFSVKFDEKSVSINLSGLETTIDPDSIRVYTTSGVVVQNVHYFIEKRVFNDGDEQLKEMLKKLRKLENQKKKLENEINSIKLLLKSIDNAVQKAISTYSVGAVIGESKREDLNITLDSLMTIHTDKMGKLIQKESVLEDVNAEIESLKSKIAEEKQKKVIEMGIISLDAEAPNPGEHKFYLEYHTKSAKWSPSYDLYLDDKPKLYLFAEITQSTLDTWEDVELIVSTKVITPVKKPEPQPWYIYASPKYRPPPKAMRLAKAAPLPEAPLEAMEMAMEEEEKLAYEEAETVEEKEEGVIEYKIKEATVEPNKTKLILLKTYEPNITTKYVWDAYELPDPVMIAEFINELGLLPSGPCRIFSDGILMGKTYIPRTLPGQKIEWAVSWVTDIETKRELMKREEHKKGLIKGKPYIGYKYRLKVKNNRKSAVEITVYDRLPIPRGSPDVEVVDKEFAIEPEFPKDGIMKWVLQLSPSEEKVIEYSYKVIYPSDIELSNLP